MEILRKLILNSLTITSVLALNSVGVNAAVSSSMLTQDEALNLISSNLDYINKMCNLESAMLNTNITMSDITFVGEEQSKDYGVQYKFNVNAKKEGSSVYMRVNKDDNSLFVLDDDRYNSSWYTIKDGKIAWIALRNNLDRNDTNMHYVNGFYPLNHELYYFKSGVMQTGWIYHNILDKWYYCWSTGERAHDTTVDGYYLGSDGAWIQ